MANADAGQDMILNRCFQVNRYFSRCPKEASDNIGVSSPSNNRQVIEKSGRSWLLGWTNPGSSELCNQFY